jgi:hypothetical protein
MAGRISKRISLLLTLLALALVVTSISFVSLHRTKVFGHLSTGDLREIDRLVHRDLRRFELPTFSKENLRNPGYVLASVRQYAARRILWVAVQDDRTVRAYVGNDKDRIAADGWSYTLHKESGWHIGAMAYWGSRDLAPKDFKVPAGL